MTRPAIPRGHRWADLQDDAAEVSLEDLQYDAACAAVQATPDGARMFDLMHRMTTFRVLAPNASDGALRELEGQRRFVAILEGRVERHNRPKPRKTETVDGGRRRQRR